MSSEPQVPLAQNDAPADVTASTQPPAPSPSSQTEDAR